MAEILDYSEPIDQGKTIKHALFEIPIINIPLHVIVDSKDRYTSLSTRQNSVDKSIRSDVNSIQFEFETYIVNEIIWIGGRHNLTDSSTKPK